MRTYELLEARRLALRDFTRKLDSAMVAARKSHDGLADQARFIAEELEIELEAARVLLGLPLEPVDDYMSEVCHNG